MSDDGMYRMTRKPQALRQKTFNSLCDRGILSQNILGVL